MFGAAVIGYGEAIFLGIIQGLTEFLPISSTAHLKVLPAFVGGTDPGAAYSAVIQLGTLLAVLLYFRKDLAQFWTAGYSSFRQRDFFSTPEARMPYQLIMGTIPICICGLLFSDFIVGPVRSLPVIASSLIGFAIVLALADYLGSQKKDIQQLDWRDILLIGLAQCLALIPGASRAGTTLTMGLLLGYNREAAMRISFLLSIPAIAISGVYELIQEAEHLQQVGFAGLWLGTLTAAGIGYITIASLLKYLRKHSALVFVVYRIALGTLIFFLLLTGKLVG